MRDKIFKEHLGFNRVRKDLRQKVFRIIDYVIVHQRKFDYKYYLAKNCPLPSGWP